MKKYVKGFLKCGFGFIKYNFLDSHIIRKNGALFYPYKGSCLYLQGTLELSGDFELNASKFKGSKAEAYLAIGEGARMIVDKKTRINYGSTINVNPGALLHIGSMTSNVGINIQCRKEINIGDDCMFGRNSVVFDSAFHPTGSSADSMKINSEPVCIGNHVWIGAYVFVNKGTNIGDGSIVGSYGYIGGDIAPGTTIVKPNDTAALVGNMWARSMNPTLINKALLFYEDNEVESTLIEDAVKKYADRIVLSLSEVIDYIDFENEDDITGKGKLDSLGLLKVVTALNNEFGIKIPYYEIRPSNFKNKDTISSLVWRVKNSTSKKIASQSVIYEEMEENDEFIVPDKSLPKKSVVEQIYDISKVYPDKSAIVSEGKEFSYSKLFDLIYGYSIYLSELGLSRGDMILAKANQSINYIVTYFASHLAGLEITTVEKNTSTESLYKMAEMINAKVISTKPEEFDNSKKYIFIDSFDVHNHIEKSRTPLNFPEETDMADVLFTTGTTGASKGIELTHKAAVCGAENMASGAHMARHTVLICPNPLSHSNAIKQLAATMISGGTFYVLDGITDLNALFEALNYHSKKVSIVLPPSGIRTIFQLAKDDFAGFADKLEYLMAATAPLPEPDRETLREMFPNSRLYNHYGCSESSTISIYDFNNYKELKNCVGIATPNTNVMFVDENRNVIESSKDNMGLLAVSGGTVMNGYYNDPEKTSEILVNGVVYTNDVGYIDENGFIFITGRNDDVINVGGLKVAPTEVESAAMELDSIADCICIGVPDDVGGQALKLLVVLSNNEKMDSKIISNYLSEKLESYKVPHLYEEVDVIEKTYNGKINRKSYK